VYERFTDRSRKVMQLADQEARRFNHEYVGTEHILLGLVKEGSGVAANVLKNLDVDLRMIRLEVEKIVQNGPNDDQVVKGRLPHTPYAAKVIDYAVEEARRLGHNYVGTEHLLLGLLREQEGVAAQVLMNLGLKIGDVREEVLNLLGHPTTDSGAMSDEPHVIMPLEQLTEGECQTIRDMIRALGERKESLVAVQDFEQAARCREEVIALKRLLAWYEWHRNRE
jgi:ATP-dependent Clp protease ATP-binding subunit ClpC